jgi:hypothetical protein
MRAKNVLKRAELQLRTRNVQDDLQSKNEEKIHRVQKVIHSNCCLTIHKVAEEDGISKTICDEVLTENLGMHLVAAKFVARLLSEDQ